MIALKILGLVVLWILTATLAFGIFYKLFEGELSDEECVVVYCACQFSAPLALFFAVCWLIAHLFYKVAMYILGR